MRVAEWEQQKHRIRETLRRLLGDLPPTFSPSAKILSTTQHDGYILQRTVFENGLGASVPGILLIPDQRSHPAPAVLYNHIHGAKYHLGKDQLFFAEDATPDGIALVKRGYIVFAIDAYAFGERQTQGPAGAQESGAATELSLFKQFLWEGRTLWGMMLHDDLLALNFLHNHPDVDPARIGTTGMSMGGSRATWLTALDDRIKVVIPVAQMTRYEDFAASGQFHLHSIYYYLPGMRRSGLDMEHLVSVVAPRPQIILIGDQDPLSPMSGVRKIEAEARQVYDRYGKSDVLRLIVYEGAAHRYIPPMHQAMLDGFDAFL